MKEIINLENDIISCNKCRRLRDVTPIPYPHIYYCNLEDIKVFAIGRNPGLENDYTNVTYEEFMEVYKERFWTCRVGKYLRQRLGDDLIKNNFFFTNVCKCSSPENDKLSPSEKEKCFDFLKKQIEIINPKVIITFSADAKSMMLNNIKNHKYNGIPVFFMYHPSYFRFASNSKKASEKQDFILNQIKNKIIGR